MPARLEHVNICVPDPVATAAVLERLFDWHIRWEGVSPGDGYSIHVGDTEGYVALYRPGHGMQAADPGRYRRSSTWAEAIVAPQHRSAAVPAIATAMASSFSAHTS